MFTTSIVASRESGIAASVLLEACCRKPAKEETIRKLRLWMKVVGALYVIIGLFLGASFLFTELAESTVGARLPDADLSGPMYEFALDTWLMFGLEVLVVGAALLWASRDAWANRILAGTVIALEAVRGIFDDLVWIARGYPPLPYVGWIVLHAVVIATGVFAWRAARAEARS